MTRTITLGTTRTKTLVQPQRDVSIVGGPRAIVVSDCDRTVTVERPARALSLQRVNRSVGVVNPVRNISVVQGAMGPRGATGPGSADSIVQVRWGAMTAEIDNTILITGAIVTLDGDPVSTSEVCIQIVVSDGAADAEPSSTATLNAVSGTALAGSGTATLTIRSNAGTFSINVTETIIGSRYLWVCGARHARLLVIAEDGVQELMF